MTHATLVLDRLRSLQTAVDKLSLRERLLVFSAIMMILGSIWQFSLMQPLTQQINNFRTEIEFLSTQTGTNNRTLEDQALQISGSGAEHQARLNRVQHQLDQINIELGEYAAELIDPAEMAHVLEGVLQDQSNLRLIRMRNLRPEALSASDETGDATFYKHGFEIEFEGSYFACLEYLQKVESLPWRFYWQILELSVAEYPMNRIRLEVSTLSLDEEWIGA